jgi:formamidopyrimidine-DNA glycosylase
MSGQLLVEKPSAPDETHLRARFTFTDGGRELRFVDQRTFGGMFVDALVPYALDPSTEVPETLQHIAPDPLEPVFSETAFAAGVRARRTGIKRALLDQSLISGVGNIYADEALWRAKLHYARPTETLTRPTISALVGHVTDVMKAALREGGTSFDSLYVDINGSSGYFDRSLNAYGQEGLPCPRCGTPIRRDPFMNRSSYTCPKCQPRPRRAHW